MPEAKSDSRSSWWAKKLVFPFLLTTFGAFLSPIADDVLSYYGIDSRAVAWFAEAVESILSAPIRFWHILVVCTLIVLGRYYWTRFRPERSGGGTTAPPSSPKKDEVVDSSGAKTADNDSSAMGGDEETFENVEVKNVLWDGTVVDGRVESLSNPKCPKCGTELTTKFDSTAGPYGPDRLYESYCPNDTCTFSKDWMKAEYRDDVKKVIEKRIRDGELVG